MIPNRPARQAALIQQTLAEILLRQSHDPRIEGVRITDIRLNPDGKLVKAYWVADGGEARRAGVKAGLDSAAGYLRRELGHKARMRNVPELRFYYDDRYDTANRVSQLLSDLGNPSGGHEMEKDHESGEESEAERH